MDLYEAIERRRSVRAYQDRPVEQDKLERILNAARMAPSASNRQPWKFVVVRQPELRRKLVPACREQAFIGQAPVVVAGVGTNPRRIMGCDIPSDPVDLAIAMEHIALSAVAEGLGTCWVGAFHQDQVKALLGVPEECKVVQMMALGYPADGDRGKDRKALGEIVCYERFT